MKYRSQWPTFILRSSIKSYWFIILHVRYYVIHQIVFKIWGNINEPWNVDHSDQLLFWGQAWSHTKTLSQAIMFIQGKNQWTMKYRSQWLTLIKRSTIRPYWHIIPSYHVYSANSLQNLRQNHWTMKYRSQWPTFILRSRIKSYWLIIPKYHFYTSNCLQDMRQNHWTMKCRSQWPAFILRSSIKSYWHIIPSYYVYTPNSLQDIRQNHWTVKCRSHADLHFMTFKALSKSGAMPDKLSLL